MNYLENAVTIITGAGSGIGAATARRLAADGAKVVLGDIDEAALKAVVADIEKAGGKAAYKVTDVRIIEDFEGFWVRPSELLVPWISSSTMPG